MLKDPCLITSGFILVIAVTYVLFFIYIQIDKPKNGGRTYSSRLFKDVFIIYVGLGIRFPIIVQGTNGTSFMM